MAKSIDERLTHILFNSSVGFLVGTSSGANVAAALQIARELGPDSQVVTVLCDRAECY
jgi:cysteine synthase A